MMQRTKSEMENLYNTPCKMYNVGAMLLNYTPRTLEEITGGATCL